MSVKIRALQAKKAAAVAAARAITNKAEAEARDLSEAEQAEFKAQTDQIAALNAAIEREQLLATEEGGLNAAGGVTVPAGARISVEDNRAADPTRGFATRGEFYRAVAAAGLRRGVDPRLNIGVAAAAPTTFSNEAGGADGGFAIPPAFSQELWRLSLGENSLLPMTSNTELTGNSMIFPKDESTPWGGSGAQVYWQAEAQQAGQSKVNIGVQTMVLHKLMGLVPVTNELVEDGFAIDSYLTPLLSDRITWKVNEAMPILSAPVQPPKSSQTRSHFVTLASR